MSSESNSPQGSSSEKGNSDSWFAVDIHPWVFFTSGGLIIGSVVVTILFQSRMDDLFVTLQDSISAGAG